ncbi:MAG: hypothetical protein LBD89_00545 [Tannerellaceae bacterium]|jgi:hypothetical protein|nr:hypothetical protein [Tannerellaceae bacterium]
MKHTRKIIPFLLALFFVACEKEDILIGEWSLVDTDIYHKLDLPLSDSTIVFYPDGKFRGALIYAYTEYSLLDDMRIGLKTHSEAEDFAHIYSYVIVGNTLTMCHISGDMPYSMMISRLYMYRKK